MRVAEDEEEAMIMYGRMRWWWWGGFHVLAAARVNWRFEVVVNQSRRCHG